MDFLRRHLAAITPADALAGVAISIGLLLVGLLFAGAVVVLWPPDHFLTERPLLEGRHPLLRGAAHIGKNALGALLLVLGVILALPGIPGPGLAVFFIGFTLIDFPAKRRIELWLMRKPPVRRTIDRVRLRFGRERLILDEADSRAEGVGPGR